MADPSRSDALAFGPPGLVGWLAAAFMALALAMGVWTTRGVEWPDANWTGVGIDMYRDIALAQTIKESGYGPDAAYLGERSWYNPLAPAITAAVSRATGWPVPFVTARIGTYANLIAPIAFFLVCATLFGRWTALYALVGFLFLTSGSMPSWVSATYSPWFLPVNFVQGFFYLTVIVFYRAYRDDRWGWHLAAGAAWGVTFLGHAAPALILGVMGLIRVAAVWLPEGWVPARWRPPVQVSPRGALARFAAAAVMAMVVSTPLLVNIVGYYGLAMQHFGPSRYSDPLLSRQLPTLLWAHVTLPMVVALVGLGSLRRGASADTRLPAWLLSAWLLSAAVLLAYGFLVAAARQVGVTLPSVVPSFHFFFYVKAGVAVLFGLGMDAIARRTSARTAALVCVGLLAAGAYTYFTRADFGPARRDALAVIGSAPAEVSDWLRDHAGPSDVVLASDGDSATIVGPAGAKVVTTAEGFSSPYVDRSSRVKARAGMFEALYRQDMETFRALARPYRVTWVLARTPISVGTDARGVDVELAFERGEFRLYRVGFR